MVSPAIRGGRSVKTRLQKVNEKKKMKYSCPRCEKMSVKRKETGIWVCNSCGIIFAGGAYSPTTPGGKVSARVIADLKKGGKKTQQ